MSNDILVSIIIPAYNAQNSILICLESVLNQTYKNIEILVINDGSTDKTLEILEKIQDKRLKVFSQDNKGVSSARNKGLENALGQYIAFVDSDDFIDKDFIHKMLKSAMQNSADIVVCDVILTMDKKTSIFHDIDAKIGKINPKEYLKLLMLDRSSKGWVWNKFFKKDIVKNIRFNEKIVLAEDKLFLIFAIVNSKNIYKLNSALYKYDVVYKTFTSLHYKNGLEIDKITRNLFLEKGIYNEFADEIFFMKIINYMFLVVNKDKFKNYLYELKALSFDIKNIINSPYFNHLDSNFKLIFKVIYFLKNHYLIYCFLSILNSKISKRILKKLI